MSQQRFYPYTPPPNEGVPCDAGMCECRASWWDAALHEYWCDFHAMSCQAVPVSMRCVSCHEWCLWTEAIQGICPACRSLAPELWSDVPSGGITLLSSSLMEEYPHWCSFCGIEREDAERTLHCPECWSPLEWKDEEVMQ